MKRLVATLIVLAASPAWADQVRLRGGGTVSGEIVERTPTSLVLEVGPGRMTLPMSLVERIVASTSDLALYRQRAARLSEGDAPGWLALGRWAEAHDLMTQARDAYEHVLRVDPDNAAANAALGRVRLAGQWLKVEDANRARGLVEFEGLWVSPAERTAMLEERAIEARGREMAAEADARAREAEARARAAEADARRAEADAASGSGGIPYPYVFSGGVYGGVYGGGYGIGYGGRPGTRLGHGHMGGGLWNGGQHSQTPPLPVIEAPRPPARDNGSTRAPARPAPQTSAGFAVKANH